MDKISAAERSRVMSRVRSKDTQPEIRARGIIHRLGYRYRLHRGDLPGKPDLVFPGRLKVIFVHGCFWHGHSCKRGKNRPPQSSLYWTQKLERNKTRDRRNKGLLRKGGWDVLVLWECQLKDEQHTKQRVEQFLEHA